MKTHPSRRRRARRARFIPFF